MEKVTTGLAFVVYKQNDNPKKVDDILHYLSELHKIRIDNVVVVTNKDNFEKYDQYNCIHYDNNLWEFGAYIEAVRWAKRMGLNIFIYNDSYGLSWKWSVKNRWAYKGFFRADSTSYLVDNSISTSKGLVFDYHINSRAFFISKSDLSSFLLNEGKFKKIKSLSRKNAIKKLENFVTKNDLTRLTDSKNYQSRWKGQDIDDRIKRVLMECSMGEVVHTPNIFPKALIDRLILSVMMRLKMEKR